jgi:hypothetical protein
MATKKTARKTTKKRTGSSRKRKSSSGGSSGQAGFLRRPTKFSARQFLIFALIFAAVGGLVLWKGFALRSYAATWGYERSPDLQNPVEQAMPNGSNATCTPDPGTVCIVNPTNCAWDIDDSIYRVGNGSLNANTSFSDTQCVMADGYGSSDHHAMAFLTTSPSKDLKVTVTNSQGMSWTASPVVNSNSNRNWDYRLCIMDDTRLGAYPPVEGSNGGNATPVDYTYTITAGSRGASSVSSWYHVVPVAIANNYPDLGCTRAVWIGDTIPPSVPGNLQVTSTSAGSATFAFDLSTDNVPGFPVTYRLYMGVAGKRGVVSYARNDSLQGSPYTKTGLTPGTTYYFYVVAVDWGNNESAPSNKVTVTVP